MDEKNSPVFIVGCPRSGTTLTQSLLSSHTDIASYPETHFFSIAVPKIKLLRLLGIASPNGKEALLEILINNNHKELSWIIPQYTLFMHSYVNSFALIMQILTHAQGKNRWVEKTPKHLHYIDIIERYLNEVKFIHIIRNGLDVIASLFDVTHRYPDIWGGERDINKCINRWKMDISISSKFINKMNHKHIKFEHLVNNPAEILDDLCKFIGIQFEESMLENYRQSADQLILNHEKWKSKVKGIIINNGEKKHHNVFNEAERQYVLSQISDVGNYFEGSTVESL